MSSEKTESLKLGQRIRQVRKKAGLNLGDVARLVGCSAANLSSIERGEWGPSGPLLLNLCRELGVNKNWLTEGIAPIYKEGGPAGEGTTGEPPKTYEDPKRLRLVHEVKRLVNDAPDKTIDALLKLIEVLKEVKE